MSGPGGCLPGPVGSTPIVTCGCGAVATYRDSRGREMGAHFGDSLTRHPDPDCLCRCHDNYRWINRGSLAASS